MNIDFRILLLISALILISCGRSKTMELEDVELALSVFNENPEHIRNVIDDYSIQIKSSDLTSGEKAKKLAVLSIREIEWGNPQAASKYLLDSLSYGVRNDMVHSAVFLSAYDSSLLNQVKTVVPNDDVVFDKKRMQIWKPLLQENDLVLKQKSSVMFSELLSSEGEDFLGVRAYEFNFWIISVLSFCDLNANQILELYAYFKNVFLRYYGVILDGKKTNGITDSDRPRSALQGMMFLHTAAKEKNIDDLRREIEETAMRVRELIDKVSSPSLLEKMYFQSILNDRDMKDERTGR